MEKRQYRFAFDIGIGSCGWAVVSENETGNRRIEDAGSRIFDSGEMNEGKDRKSQKRRGFRGVRRVLRRRQHRKELLKNYVRYIQFMSDYENRCACESPADKILPVKVKGLDEKLTKAELLQVLIHACNHRGYKDFYDVMDTDEKGSTEEEEEKKNQAAANRLDQALAKSHCRTISEYLCQNCTIPGTNRIDYRNRFYKNENRMIIRRKHVENEVHTILEKQREWYPELTDQKIERIMGVIFSQRDFEDGPGDASDKYRRYTGFLESLGYCRFYPEERRGFRNTVLGDVYAAINALSQYRYVHADTGEAKLTQEAAGKMVSYIMKQGSLTRTQASKLLKPLGIAMYGSKDVDKTLVKSFRFLKEMKKIAEKCQVPWESLLSETDLTEYEEGKTSLLNQLGTVCSMYQTPHRKEEELKKLQAKWEHVHLPPAFWNALKRHKFNGTSSVSYHHMADAIEAFLKGDIYGNFQWNKQKQLDEKQESQRERFLSAKVLMQDEDVKDNPVVLRSINETRKVLNCLIRLYGSPAEIHVEVADDVARSYLERKRIQKMQRDHEKTRDAIKKKIAEILHCEESEVKGSQIERYKLYMEQEGKCLYSGRELNLEMVLDTKSHAYEVDHIIPYSLILDNTLANKALVCGNENQAKGQQTPLMYLKGEKKEAFIERVKAEKKRTSHPISNKKYDYLMLATLYGKEAKEILTGWKSRNINDTRYITKYVVGLIKNHLQFAGEKARVFGIRGHITSRFRKEWLGKNTWGSDEKCRANYLNHAADAIVLANLSKMDVEIAIDYEKLRQIQRHYGETSIQYDHFLNNAAQRIAAFYPITEEAIRKQLVESKRTPSYVPNLEKEVDLRLGNPEGETRSEEEYRAKTEMYYEGAAFVVRPHLPYVSMKVERKFRGEIAKSNPIRLVEENGIFYQVSRKAVEELKSKDLSKLYTSDGYLIEALEKAFTEGEKYLNNEDDKENKKDSQKKPIKKYMEKEHIDVFRTTNGQPVRKVSIKEGKISSYYKKNIDDTNYSILGLPKYYCVEIYKDTKGKTRMWGIRYVDVISCEGKICLKDDIKLPKKYAKHLIYLFSGEYLEVTEDGKETYVGFYQSVKAATRSEISITINPGKKVKGNDGKEKIQWSKNIPITQKATVKKYVITLNGQKAGEVKEGEAGYPCFAHCLSKKEND